MIDFIQHIFNTVGKREAFSIVMLMAEDVSLFYGKYPIFLAMFPVSFHRVQSSLDHGDGTLLKTRHHEPSTFSSLEEAVQPVAAHGFPQWL